MYVIKEGCPGCGACLDVCPVNAIKPGKLAVTISSDCIDCGICKAACPIGLIYQAAAAADTSSDTAAGSDEGGEERG